MKQNLKIYLQEDMIKNVKQRVKNGDFKSTGEYFEYLFKKDTENINLKS